jgi:hypothetical protein
MLVGSLPEMPKNARSRLPQQVAEFLEEFALTGDGKRAAINVGVHPRVAGSFVRETMDHPDAREAFDQILRTRFSHARPIGLNLLIEMVQDPKKEFSGPVRLEAAKSLVKIGTTEAIAPRDRKDLHELSRDELLQIVNAGEQELAGRAKLIDNRSIDGPIDVQVIDIEQ